MAHQERPLTQSSVANLREPVSDITRMSAQGGPQVTPGFPVKTGGLRPFPVMRTRYKGPLVAADPNSRRLELRR
jgi:hypothetical protein